jgi:hypothetical protein
LGCPSEPKCRDTTRPSAAATTASRRGRVLRPRHWRCDVDVFERARSVRHYAKQSTQPDALEDNRFNALTSVTTCANTATVHRPGDELERPLLVDLPLLLVPQG